MFEITLKIETEEKFREFFQESQELWDKVGLSMSPNNDETRRVLKDITE